MVTNQSNDRGPAGEQRYHHLFEHIPVCIFVVDLTATPAAILEANRRAELVYGYTASELTGMTIAALVPEDARAAILTIIQQVQRGQTVTAETTNQHRDGTRFPVRVIAAPDPTDDHHMIVTVEDITAEKQRRSEAEAIEAERLRIAHEFHDGVAQNLAGLRFKSVLWHRLADADPPGMHVALDELQAELNVAISDLRRAIFALRPVDLDGLGFFAALTQLVGDFGDYNQLVTQLDVSGSKDNLPVIYELPLFRILQESLNNINRHAARVQCWCVSLWMRLAVSGSRCGTTAAALIRINSPQSIATNISASAKCASGPCHWAACWTFTALLARARS